MSAKNFQSLKKGDLLTIAEEFAVDVQPTDNKAVIVAALAQDGVTVADAARFVPELAEALGVEVSDPVERLTKVHDEPADAMHSSLSGAVPTTQITTDDEVYLIRMRRPNPTYEVRGVIFTRDNPFAVMAAEDAEWLVANVEGFSYATPKETKEFYA